MSHFILNFWGWMLSSAPMSRLKIDLCVMVLFLVLWFELPGGVFVLTPLSLLPECPAALSWLALQALFVIPHPPALPGDALVLCAISLILPTVKPFCDLYPGQPDDFQWRAAPSLPLIPYFGPSRYRVHVSLRPFMNDRA